MHESSPELKGPLPTSPNTRASIPHPHVHKNPRAGVGTCIKAPSVFLDWPSQSTFCTGHTIKKFFFLNIQRNMFVLIRGKRGRRRDNASLI